MRKHEKLHSMETQKKRKMHKVEQREKKCEQTSWMHGSEPKMRRTPPTLQFKSIPPRFLYETGIFNPNIIFCLELASVSQTVFFLPWGWNMLYRQSGAAIVKWRGAKAQANEHARQQWKKIVPRTTESKIIILLWWFAIISPQQFFMKSFFKLSSINIILCENSRRNRRIFLVFHFFLWVDRVWFPGQRLFFFVPVHSVVAHSGSLWRYFTFSKVFQWISIRRTSHTSVSPSWTPQLNENCTETTTTRKTRKKGKLSRWKSENLETRENVKNWDEKNRWNAKFFRENAVASHSSRQHVSSSSFRFFIGS